MSVGIGPCEPPPWDLLRHGLRSHLFLLRASQAGRLTSSGIIGSESVSSLCQSSSPLVLRRDRYKNRGRARGAATIWQRSLDDHEQHRLVRRCHAIASCARGSALAHYTTPIRNVAMGGAVGGWRSSSPPAKQQTNPCAPVLAVHGVCCLRCHSRPAVSLRDSVMGVHHV